MSGLRPVILFLGIQLFSTTVHPLSAQRNFFKSDTLEFPLRFHVSVAPFVSSNSFYYLYPIEGLGGKMELWERRNFENEWTIRLTEYATGVQMHFGFDANEYFHTRVSYQSQFGSAEQKLFSFHQIAVDNGFHFGRNEPWSASAGIQIGPVFFSQISTPMNKFSLRSSFSTSTQGLTMK